MCYYDCEEIRFLIECDPVKFELINEEWEHSSYLIKKQNDSVSFNANILAKEDSDDSAAQKAREENKNGVKQQSTSRLRKTLSHFFYLFADLEGYLFLKNEAYVLTPFLFIRNFYHYFTRLKIENPKEILKVINKQTPLLPQLTPEAFEETFNHFLQNSSADTKDWRLNQQVNDRLKIIRSCCQVLREKNEEFIDKIIKNESYNYIYDAFLKKNADFEQKKIFLENLITAFHVNEMPNSCLEKLEHYSINETYARVENHLKNFDEKGIQDQFAHLVKNNQQAAESSFYSNDKKNSYKAWSGFVSSHSWTRNLDTFFVKVPTWFKKAPILTGKWALIALPIILIIYFFINIYLAIRKNSFGKEFILLAEVNEKSQIENTLQKIMSRRFHEQQILYLINETKIVALFENKKINDEKSWKNFSDHFAGWMQEIHPLYHDELENGPLNEEELANQKAHSIIYCYVSDVNQKTQFWLIVFSKGINSIVCAGLFVSCASLVLLQLASFSCSAGWAPVLAAAIASPYVFLILVAVIFTILLLNHYFDTCKREQQYQEVVTYHLDKKCKYRYLNKEGESCVHEITQWKKFEYLSKDIESLEKYVKSLLIERKKNIFSEEGQTEINKLLNRKGILEYYRCDKTLQKYPSKKGLFEYIFSRLMVFFTGGMYGFSFQYALGNAFCAKLISGAINSVLFLVFLPLIIVNGIVNLLVYDLHEKQKEKLFILENLDAILSSFEDRKELLLCIAAMLNMPKKQQGTLSQDTLLEDKKVSSEQTTKDPLTQDNKSTCYTGPITEFFIDSLRKKILDTKSLEMADSQVKTNTVADEHFCSIGLAT